MCVHVHACVLEVEYIMLKLVLRAVMSLILLIQLPTNTSSCEEACISLMNVECAEHASNCYGTGMLIFFI